MYVSMFTLGNHAISVPGKNVGNPASVITYQTSVNLIAVALRSYYTI